MSSENKIDLRNIKNILRRVIKPMNDTLTSLSGLLNGNSVGTSVPANAVFTDTTYNEATTTSSGLMSSSDKTKLNSITNTVVSSTDVDAIIAGTYTAS